VRAQLGSEPKRSAAVQSQKKLASVQRAGGKRTSLDADHQSAAAAQQMFKDNRFAAATRRTAKPRPEYDSELTMSRAEVDRLRPAISSEASENIGRKKLADAALRRAISGRHSRSGTCIQANTLRVQSPVYGAVGRTAARATRCRSAGPDMGERTEQRSI